MTQDEKLIEAGHQCDVSEPGYYWARLVIWQPPGHLPQKRQWPALCNPCPVQLSYSTTGTPILRALGSNRVRVWDWLFIERIADIAGVEHSKTSSAMGIGPKPIPPQTKDPIKPWIK